jgi:uncharacterized protein YcbX
VTVQVTRLAVTAIKGFGIREVDEIDLRRPGAVGNRDYFVVDEQLALHSAKQTAAFIPYWSLVDGEGRLQVGRRSEVLQHGEVELGAPVRSHFFADRYVEGRRVLGPWDGLLSEITGHRVHLVRALAPSGGFDVHPVTLQSEASVSALGSAPEGGRLDPRRFRMLITCDGAGPFEEDTWSGRAAQVGGATVMVGGPVPRCAAVQRDAEDGSSGVNALRLIRQRRGVGMSELGRGLNLGVYARVSSEGVVKIGDRLTVTPARDSDR